MRILSIGNLFPPHSFGGYEVMWESWARHAAEREHEVRILASDFRLDAEPGLADGPPGVDVRRELKWYWRDHKFPYFTPWTRLRIERHNAHLLETQIEDFEPEVIVWWQMAGMSISLMEQARRAEIPSIAVLADYWLEYATGVDGWLKMFAGRTRIARLVEARTGLITQLEIGAGLDAVFASNTIKKGAADVQARFADSPVARHGPDLDLFELVPTKPWRWELLYLGRIDPHKGIDLAIEALLHLPEQATLRIVGGGDDEHKSELVALIAKLGLAERVSFDSKQRADVPAVYAASDVVIFPVRWAEPWGLVPCEAMAVGRPVVGSGRGGSGEYMTDGENCLIFDPDDGAETLAERVQRLATDPDLRARLIAGGTKTVAELSDPDFDVEVQHFVEQTAERGQPSSEG